MTGTSGPTALAAAARRPFAWRLRRRLAGFHPAALIAAIPGPIFTKETQLMGRKATTYWTRGVYALLLFILISMVFLGVYLDTSSTSSAARLQQYQVIAPAVTIAILWFQFVLLTVCAAALCSGAICEERRKGTLSALLTTPLTAWQILLGKIAGGSVQLLILALFSTPLLLAVRVFGGVPAETVVGALALTIANALLAATLAAWHSIHVPRAATAMLASLLSFALIQFGPALVYVAIAYYSRIPPRPWFAYFCTPLAMGGLTADLFGGAGAGMPWSVWAAVQYSALYTLACTIVVFIAASFNLRWWMMREAAGGAPTRPAATAAETQPASTQASDPRAVTDRAKRRRAIPHPSREVGDRPVLWRELRQTAFRSSRVLWILTTFVVALLIYLYFVAEVHERPLHMVITAILSVVCVSVAAVAATAAINGEQESRTLDSLLTTPLSAREIVRGKFWGALRKLWYFPAVLLAHFLFTTLIIPINRPMTIVHLALLLPPAMGALCASGVWLSTIFRKSTVAAGVNFGLALGVWGALPLGVALTVVSLFRGFLAERVMSFLALLNPVPMSVLAAVGGYTQRGESATPYDVFDLGRITTFQFTLLTLAFAGIYSLAAFCFLERAAARLAATSGRAR